MFELLKQFLESEEFMVLGLLVVIAFIIISTSKFKLHPFIALILASLLMGLFGRINPIVLETTIRTGFGQLLTYIGIVIVLGTMIGVILEKSGAAVKMADVVLRVVGPKRPALAMGIIGWIVSIPVFCDSGFVILSSLRKSVTQRSKASAVAMSIALATGLYASHTLVPPTPGPISAAANLGLQDQLGLIIFFGLGISFFTMLAGLVWAKISGKKYKINEDIDNEQLDLNGFKLDEELIEKTYGKLPSALLSFAPIIIPIFLIALGTVANFPSLPFGPKDSKIYITLYFMGQPMMALLAGLLSAIFLIPNFNKETLNKLFSEGIVQAGPIILITAAGGALGAVIKATPVVGFIGESLSSLGLGIFVPFILAAAIKTAQGSSTTSLVTTSAIMMPLLPALGLDSLIGSVLTVMAIGAGAMTVSHTNDSYFWVVSQFSGIDVKTAFKTHTIATLIQGVVTIIIVAILAVILL